LPDPVGPLIKVVRSARAIASSLRSIPTSPADNPIIGVDTRPRIALHTISVPMRSARSKINNRRRAR